VSGAYLLLIPGIQAERLPNPCPHAASCRHGGAQDEIQKLYDTQAEALLFFTYIASLLAGTLAFGVVYNSARISLAERSHELASSGCSGTPGEISYIFWQNLPSLHSCPYRLGLPSDAALQHMLRTLSSRTCSGCQWCRAQTYALAATGRAGFSMSVRTDRAA